MPPPVRERAADLRSRLLAAGVDPRDPLTLTVKRLDDADPARRKRVRRALADMPPFAARVSRIETFENPPTGPAPVVYFPVEGSGIELCHRKLCEVADPAPEIEGEEYTPHITLGRGGGSELAGEEIEPVEWTVDELHLYDARYDERLGRIPLG